MKTLLLVSLFAARSLVAAEPAATRGPDFVPAKPARTVDRSLAASGANQPIEPSALVTFAFDSTTLDPIAVSELDGVVRWMKHHPEQHLVLEGHTDVIGSADYNFDLGKRRAIAVRDHLRSWGISGDRVVVAVFGEADAHRRVDPSDRRVVLFASTHPIRELTAVMLDHSRAESVVWTDRGTRLEESRSITASR